MQLFPDAFLRVQRGPLGDIGRDSLSWRHGEAWQYWQDGDSTYNRIAARNLRGVKWSEATEIVADVWCLWSVLTKLMVHPGLSPNSTARLITWDYQLLFFHKPASKPLEIPIPYV